MLLLKIENLHKIYHNEHISQHLIIMLNKTQTTFYMFLSSEWISRRDWKKIEEPPEGVIYYSLCGIPEHINEAGSPHTLIDCGHIITQGGNMSAFDLR